MLLSLTFRFWVTGWQRQQQWGLLGETETPSPEEVALYYGPAGPRSRPVHGGGWSPPPREQPPEGSVGPGGAVGEPFSRVAGSHRNPA